MKIQKLLWVLLITVSAFSVGYASPPTINKPLQLQKSYTSQLGVRELTGHNDGKTVEMYLSTVNLGRGNPWCAAFVKWNLQQCNIPNTINGMALSCHNEKNVIYENRHFNKELQPGDVFTLYFPRLHRIGHTGFYDRRINTAVYRSVEGNTNEAGSREGDGVYAKYRSFRATYSISRWIG